MPDADSQECQERHLLRLSGSSVPQPCGGRQESTGGRPSHHLAQQRTNLRTTPRLPRFAHASGTGRYTHLSKPGDVALIKHSNFLHPPQCHCFRAHPPYRRRSVIEQCVGWLKGCRRIGTRFEKLAISFVAMFKPAMIERYLRLSFSDQSSDGYIAIRLSRRLTIRRVYSGIPGRKSSAKQVFYWLARFCRHPYNDRGSFTWWARTCRGSKRECLELHLASQTEGALRCCSSSCRVGNP